MTKKSYTKPKKKKYVIKSSESEVYQRENYQELVVEDSSGVLQKEGVLEEMFDSLGNYGLRNYVSLNFDQTRFETDVRFKTRGTDTYVKVSIKEKPWFKRLLEKFY